MKRSNVTMKKFKAALEPLDDGLGWIVAWVPFEIAKVWPKMIRLRVVVEVAGEQFRTSLFAAKHGVVPEHRRKAESTGMTPAKNALRGGHFFVVNKKMQVAAGAGVGSVVEFAMWADLEERKAKMAPELAAILKGEKRLAKWYERLNDATRWAIEKWMNEAKSKDARMRRAEQMAERLMETMDAEEALPPLIETALRRRRGAMEGWEKMSATKRQGLLMAVFYYRTPESRLKRAEKVAEECAGKVSVHEE
jgi:uncharacterized protein YdeI (YjbR/CyaY-like superfamily)